MASQDDYQKALNTVDLEMFQPNSSGSRTKAANELDVYEKLQMLLDYINNLQGQPGADPFEAAQARNILASQDPEAALQVQPGFADRLIQDYSQGALDQQIQDEVQASSPNALSDEEVAQMADQRRLNNYRELQSLGSMLIPRAIPRIQE